MQSPHFHQAWRLTRPSLPLKPSAAAVQEWEEEYERVLDEWAALERGRPATVQRHAGLGAAIVRSPRALHYYSLFSFAIGCDTVVTVMPGQKYEVESR